jgi:tetratricopeptide (TPR) repeat protein
MRRTVFLFVIAICTLPIGPLRAGVEPGAAADPDLELAFRGLPRLEEHYLRARDQGSLIFPLTARILRREGVHNLRGENREQGLAQLRLAGRMDDAYAAPRFALARDALTRGRPEALAHAVEGVGAMLRGFDAQHRMVVTLLLTATLVLLLALPVVTFGLALRYLPFCHHLVVELLSRGGRIRGGAFLAWVLLLLPLAWLVGPLPTTCFYLLLVWVYLRRTEVLWISLLLGGLGGILIVSPVTERLTPGLDPESRVSLVARAQRGPFDPNLVRSMERLLPGTDPALRPALHLALGHQYVRAGQTGPAREAYLKALKEDSTLVVAYNNLANVYFQAEDYSRAATGYRRAVELDPLNPVPHYNLGQTNIKNLLFAESSRELEKASSLGFAAVRKRTQEGTGLQPQVYAISIDSRTLWNLCLAEGAGSGRNLVWALLAPFSPLSQTATGVVLLGTLALGLLLALAIPSRLRSFQCSNCSRLACNGCCGSAQGMALCSGCAGAIEKVSSEKVAEAMLRSRRQRVFQGRKKARRLVTLLLPGMAAIYFGRTGRGMLKAMAVLAILLFLAWGGAPIAPSPALDSALPGLLPRILLGALLLLLYLQSILARYPREPRVLRRESKGATPVESAPGDQPRRYVM